MKTKDDLLQDFIYAESFAIHEFSSDSKQYLRRLYSTAREYANDLDIQWRNSYFSSSDLDIINDYCDDIYTV